MQDIRARLTLEYDGKLKTKQDEVERHIAEIGKLRTEIIRLGAELANMAISADATSQQADFIRRLREQVEQASSESTALRRKNEDYITSAANTEATLQGALANHRDQMAVMRTELDTLGERLLSQQRVHNTTTGENLTLAAEAAGLRDSILPKDNTIAQLTLQMEENNNTIQSLDD